MFSCICEHLGGKREGQVPPFPYGSAAWSLQLSENQAEVSKEVRKHPPHRLKDIWGGWSLWSLL